MGTEVVAAWLILAVKALFCWIPTASRARTAALFVHKVLPAAQVPAVMAW